MLVGEQPGDVEDAAGHPFVGPAGKLLRKLLAEAKIAEEETYLTNAVKHFKWRPSAGRKKRIHDKPNWTEVKACGHWLRSSSQPSSPSSSSVSARPQRRLCSAARREWVP